MSDQWYVDAARQPVNLDAVRDANGNAVSDVFRIALSRTGTPLLFLWVRSGQTITDQALADAKGNVSVDPVPAAPVPPIYPVVDLVTQDDLAGYATQAELAAKADSAHTHEIADVNGLQAALDGKADAV